MMHPRITGSMQSRQSVDTLVNDLVGIHTAKLRRFKSRTIPPRCAINFASSLRIDAISVGAAVLDDKRRNSDGPHAGFLNAARDDPKLSKMGTRLRSSCWDLWSRRRSRWANSSTSSVCGCVALFADLASF
jgi:hypothetical protein